MHATLLAIALLLTAGCIGAADADTITVCTDTKTDTPNGTVYTRECEEVPNVCEYKDVSNRTWTARCE